MHSPELLRPTGFSLRFLHWTRDPEGRAPDILLGLQAKKITTSSELGTASLRCDTFCRDYHGSGRALKTRRPSSAYSRRARARSMAVLRRAVLGLV